MCYRCVCGSRKASQVDFVYIQSIYANFIFFLNLHFKATLYLSIYFNKLQWETTITCRW